MEYVELHIYVKSQKWIKSIIGGELACFPECHNQSEPFFFFLSLLVEKQSMIDFLISTFTILLIRASAAEYTSPGFTLLDFCYCSLYLLCRKLSPPSQKLEAVSVKCLDPDARDVKQVRKSVLTLLTLIWVKLIIDLGLGFVNL